MIHPTPVTPFPVRSSRQVLGAVLSELEPSLMRPERLVEPDSWAGHLPFAFWITVAAQPRRYVELGVHTGNSYCAVAQAVAHYALGTDCFGIDHWFGDEQAGLYGEDVYADLKAWHDPRYRHFSRLLRMSFEDGRAHVDDGSVDILHIDGLHTYEAVRTDFETWRSKMSDRCIVLFHDTNVFKDDFGVWRYWREIQAQYPTVDFLHSNGLGVAYTGSLPLDRLPPAAAALFSLAGDEHALAVTRTYFTRLGDGLIEEIRLGETRRRGEKAARDLHTAYRDLVAIDRDRARIIDEQTALRERALKWDRLAVRTGGAIGLDLEDISAAVDGLYNGSNPQARRDRGILKRQFADLIRSGTFDPAYKDLALRFADRLGRRLKARVLRQSVPDEDPAIAAIRASGLFDESHYALASEARAGGRDPLDHYLAIGEAKRLAPSRKFDPDYYARHQADVAESGFGLLRHYVLFGQHEKRHALAPAQRLAIPPLAESGRPRVLLLIPEADRTDATVTAWNIARLLKPTHDVVAFFEKGGLLRDSFATVCATVDMPEEPGLQRTDLIAVLERLARELRPTFAIAANADTREYVRGLAAANIGVVQLVQEFSASIRPAVGVYNFLPFAHRLVFPARAVADSFRREHPYLSRCRFDILPPGPTISPEAAGHPFGTEAYGASIRQRLRPVSHAGDFLVVGIGDVCARKGADIFASVAAAAGAASAAGRPLRFVWIGNGFDASGFDAFSGLLADQIARSEIGDRFEIVADLEEYDEVFRQADALALTARLDPLPNAALNALVAGVPVVCFEKASSLAEQMLEAGPESARLVVPYLDIPAMAARLVGLADDQAGCQGARAAMRSLGTERFDLEKYVAGIVRLGHEAAEDARAIERDHAAIAADRRAFSPAVYGGTWPADTYPQDLLHTYLLRSRIARGGGTLPTTGLRRPRAGFNPIIYAEDRMTGDHATEPFVDWLAHGKPEGRWTHRLVELKPAATPQASTTRALLHGHFYYVDLLDDFLARLNRNTSTMDLILTVPDDGRAESARQAVARQPIKGDITIKVVGNVGRDIAPFLSGLDRDMLERYDILGHVHGKKSPHVEAVTGEQWRTFLWEHVIGGRTQAADLCLAAMESDPTLGLVFPEDANLHGWDANLDIAAPLARRMGRETPLPQAFEWPIGTMFWARRAALAPLFDLGLDWSDYPKEPLAGDGTLLHALERLIPFAVEQAGFGYAASHLEEVQR